MTAGTVTVLVYFLVKKFGTFAIGAGKVSLNAEGMAMLAGMIMADHGNDPNIGHSKHTRERVPLLVYKKGITGRSLGRRKTLSDIGATVCDYFNTNPPENGKSFLSLLKE